MNKFLRILSIDPSGTGTTGTFSIVKGGFFPTGTKNYSFREYQSKEWEKHFEFVVNIIEEFEPDIVLYENTNYVYGRQQSGTVGLCKLIGAIAGLKYTSVSSQKIDGVLVNTVKAFRDKVQTGSEEIAGLSFQEGRGHGWTYWEKKISKHLVDALIIYHLWTREHLPNKEVIEQKITELKNKKRLGIRQQEQLEKYERTLKWIE